MPEIKFDNQKFQSNCNLPQKDKINHHLPILIIVHFEVILNQKVNLFYKQ